jgi:hypothetical protein
MAPTNPSIHEKGHPSKDQKPEWRMGFENGLREHSMLIDRYSSISLMSYGHFDVLGARIATKASRKAWRLGATQISHSS